MELWNINMIDTLLCGGCDINNYWFAFNNVDKYDSVIRTINCSNLLPLMKLVDHSNECEMKSEEINEEWH